MTSRRGWRALTFALYCGAVFVVLGEMVARLSGVATRHFYDAVYERFDADIPYVHKANLRGARGWNDTIFNTDALGLRSRQGGEPCGPKRAGEYRVAIVGDSVTFGEGVATADVFSTLVEDRLHQSGRTDVRVFNFGVSGYSVRQMAATVERRVDAVDPDLVLTVLIPADFDLSRIGTLDDSGTVRSSGSSERAAWLQRPLRRLHLVWLLRDAYHAWQPTWTSPPIRDVPESYAYVGRLRATCAARRFACGLVLLSTKIDDGFGPIGAPLTHEGLPVLDLTRLVDEFTIEEFNAGPHDPHPSARVHRRIADELTPWIRDPLPPG